MQVLSREARATFDTDKQQLEVVMLAAPLRLLEPPNPAAEASGAAGSAPVGQQGSGTNQLHACGPAAPGTHAAAEASAISGQTGARGTGTDLLHESGVREATRDAAAEAYAAGRAAAAAPEPAMLPHTVITELAAAPGKERAAAVCTGEHSQEGAAAAPPPFLLPHTVITELAAAPAKQRAAAVCIRQHRREGAGAAALPLLLPRSNIMEAAAEPAKQRAAAGCIGKHSQEGAAAAQPLALLSHTVITELDDNPVELHTAVRCSAAPSEEPAICAAHQGACESSESAAGGENAAGAHTAGEDQSSQQEALHVAGAPPADSIAPMEDKGLWPSGISAGSTGRPAAHKERGTKLEGPLDMATTEAASSGAVTENERLWLRVHDERDRAQQAAHAPGSVPGHADRNAGFMGDSGSTAVAACGSDAAPKQPWEVAGNGASLRSVRAAAASLSLSGDGGSAAAVSAIGDGGSGTATASLSVGGSGDAKMSLGKLQVGQEHAPAGVCTAPCPSLSGQATKVDSAGKETSQGPGSACGAARGVAQLGPTGPMQLPPRMSNVYADDLV